MPTQELGIIKESASEHITMPAVPTAQQAPAPAIRATTFLSLPRELRDQIYSHLFAAVYTQSRRMEYPHNTTIDCVSDAAEARRSDRLAIIQASRGLWEEGSIILYGGHLFRFRVGFRSSNAIFLTQRTANLMQDIEISLGPKKIPESIRILQLFCTSQILRKSCLIKLQFRTAELKDDHVVQALEQLTGFKVLTFEVDVPVVIRNRQSGAPIPWVSSILAYIKIRLALALGPSMFTNGDGYRRLVFKPQDYNR